MPSYLPSDPLFAVQWHLLNTGNTVGSIAGFDINVIKVWPDYTGAGVLVTASEAGMDETHPDLIRNYRQDLAWNLPNQTQGSAAATPGDDAQNHGTPVLGLIGATEGNGLGGVGVAFNASLSMHLMDFRANTSDKDISQTLFSAEQIIASQAHVWNNSWGLGDQPFYHSDNSAAFHGMLQNVAQQGRLGLGTIIVFSAGNEGQLGYDTNYSPNSNSPYIITVAAMAQNGTPTAYSTPGSSVLISAPGSAPSSIVTTDRQGEDGYNPAPGVAGNYTTTEESYFNGTSAAAPIASGVAALILNANPNLGYRDVQEILAYSAKRAHFLPQPTNNTINGATDWNGGGLMHGYVYGFGAIDALAAVRLAESWHKTSTFQNLVVRDSLPTDSGTLNVAAGQTVTSRVSFDAPARVEHVLINLDLSTEQLQNVSVVLISPNGTESPLLLRPSALDQEGNPVTLTTRVVDTLSSVRHWGENATGTWTLRIENHSADAPVTLNDWSLQAHTLANRGPVTQIFTDEFATFALLQGKRAELSSFQGQTLNAAAVTHDTVIDLSTGNAIIAGVNTTLSDPDNFFNLYAGDGNDRLIGNARDNILMAGRGNDYVDGGQGVDALRFIRTAEKYSVQTTSSGLNVTSLAHETEGTDTLENIEILFFSDQIRLANTPDTSNRYGVDEKTYLERNPDVARAVNDGAIASGQAHYEAWGRLEWRAPTVLFDEARYLALNTDVADAVAQNYLTSGYQHYLQHGWTEGRTPSVWFDATAYLDANPDVMAAGVNPLSHYLGFGVHEGRQVVANSGDLWL